MLRLTPEIDSSDEQTEKSPPKIPSAMPSGVSTWQPPRTKLGQEVGWSVVWFRQERLGSERSPRDWTGGAPGAERVSEGSSYSLMK